MGFVTPTWYELNPLWRMFMLLGGIAIGWGINDILVSNSSDGMGPLVIGGAFVIGGTTLVEYLFNEEEDEPVAENAERPSSGDSGDC